MPAPFTEAIVGIPAGILALVVVSLLTGEPGEVEAANFREFHRPEDLATDGPSRTTDGRSQSLLSPKPEMIADFVRRLVPVTVHFGDGRVDDLAPALDPGSERVLVVCGESVSETRRPDVIADALGDQHVATWTGVRPHTPADTVRSAVAAVEADDADTVLALGGGSAVDTCKAVSARIGTGRDVDALFGEDLSRGVTPGFATSRSRRPSREPN